MEQAEEIKKMIESATNGYWVPVAIVSAAFSVILFLLVHIWNQMLKQNEKRHVEHEKHNEKQDTLLKVVSDNLTELRVLVTKIDTEQNLSKR